MKPRSIRMGLGVAAWLLACCGLGFAASTLRARATRPIEVVTVQLPMGHTLSAGDAVYRSTLAGLTQIGEVVLLSRGGSSIDVGITPTAFRSLKETTSAVCWRTRFSTVT